MKINSKILFAIIATKITIIKFNNCAFIIKACHFSMKENTCNEYLSAFV